MLLVAAIEAASVIAIVIGLCGLSGCVFTALKYNRDDTTAIVGQQSTLVHDMQAVTAELRQALQDCRERGYPPE